MFPLEFSDYQDTDVMEKSEDFLIGYLSRGAVFSTEIFDGGKRTGGG